jgi:hypothetical protein
MKLWPALVLAALCSEAGPLVAEISKPFHVLSLSGTAKLSRFEDEALPFEPGQDLPGDLSLDLEPGALVGLRVNKRVDVLISGPASLRIFSLEHPEGEELQQELVLRVDSGTLYVDPRFLLGRPSAITLDLPDASFEVKGGLPFMISADAKRKTNFAAFDAAGAYAPAERSAGAFVKLTLSAKTSGAQVWPKAFLDAQAAPLAMLVLARDYDKELKSWPRPAVLGPALLGALKDMKGLSLVEGSGDTKLAYYSNHALRSGLDDFLQAQARERGARFVVVGNLVSEELKDESPRLRRNPLMSAVAEFRVLEAFEHGDAVVSDVAVTLTARAGRALEIAGREAMEGAAQRAAKYLAGDMEDLLKGESHPPQLLKVSFSHVGDDAQRELRRKVSDLDSVQRFFKRGFAGGVFKIDVILRKSQGDFLAQLKDIVFNGFSLDEETPAAAAAGSAAEGLSFSLHPQPTPTPTPDIRLNGWRP